MHDLPTILASGQRRVPSGLDRLQRLNPSRAEAHRRYVEALVADVNLSDVTALTDDELIRALHTYQAEEKSVSQRRQQVQSVMDALNSEIATRYGAGTASVDDLLARELLDPSDPSDPSGADRCGPTGTDDTDNDN